MKFVFKSNNDTVKPINKIYIDAYIEHGFDVENKFNDNYLFKSY